MAVCHTAGWNSTHAFSCFLIPKVASMGAGPRAYDTPLIVMFISAVSNDENLASCQKLLCVRRDLGAFQM